MRTADNHISKTTVRMIELILTALVLISLVMHFSVTVHAADTVTENGWKYTTESGGGETYAVIKGYTGSDWNLKIPSKLGNYTVRKIGNYTFSEENSVLSAVIPDTVTTIGDGAFRSCKNMTSVTLGKAVSSIGMYAFSSTAISQITFPDSVTTIGESALSGCTSLKKITLSKNITRIPLFFCSRTKITEIRIPEGVTVIGDAAFQDCYSLEKVQLPKTLENISNYAFQNNYSLKLIYPPEGVTNIGMAAFDSCTSLETITLPSSLKYLNERAFLNCTSLKSVIAKTPLKGVVLYPYCVGYDTKSKVNPNVVLYCASDSEYKSFATENGIKTAALTTAPKDPAADLSLDPATVSTGGTGSGGTGSGSTGGTANTPRPAAKGTKIASKNTADKLIYQVIDASAGNPKVTIAGTGKKTASVTIPATLTAKNGVTYRVTKIAPNAFKNNKKLKKLVVNGKITEIGAKAFYGCKNLKTVKVNGNTLKKVGKGAFKKIKKNAKITIMIKNKKAWKKAVKLFKKSKPGKVKYAFKKKA